MTFTRRLAQAALFLLAAAAVFPAVAQDPRTPPIMRLGDTVRPLAYELSLTVDPGQPTFAGHVEIDVDLREPTGFFWMNGTRLDVRNAVLTSGGRRHEARVQGGGDHFIGIDFGQSVPAGRGRLALDFSGSLSDRETRGLFRQRDRGEWYAYTQFESINARRAFPCFDEPRWKTPWTVTLTVPKDHVAVANAPMASEREVEGGMKQVRFATTKPLPTYLVAFGVGPFDVVDGGVAGMRKTPLRFIVPKGRGVDTKFAVQATPKLLAMLEDYFGSPYPFEKLDSLAIPVTVSFGAMENPGLITYRMSLLVARDGLRDERHQQAYAGVGTHEMAHQWFGDLVTPAWWDDIWLNESFATWMAAKIAPRYNPAWERGQNRERQRQAAFHTDRLLSSRQVRQPVETPDHLANAFDRITYDKGGAVLTMFEAWLGEAAFRDGVRRYLKRHEWGNASADDFFRALGETDPAVVTAFRSFVLQPGLPVVDFALDCTGTRPALRLRQQRFSPLPADAAGPTWTIPVCLRADGVDKPVCTLLREREQRVELDGANRCPAWVLPNPGGTGYFLSRLDTRAAQGLSSIALSETEAIALLAEQATLVASAASPLRALLDIAGPLSRDARSTVVTAAANAIGELNPAALDVPARRDLASWVREHFGARAAQLGWVPRDGESDAVRKMRGAVVPLVSHLGEDTALRSDARKLALDWLGGNRSSLGAGYRAVLRAAGEGADAQVVDALIAAAQQSDDPATRVEIYKALGTVREPALLHRAFEYALSGKPDLREAMETYDAAGEDGDNSPALLAFVRERFDALAAVLPEETRARLPRRFAALCRADERAALQQLLGGARAQVPGLERNLAQALEAIDICVKSRSSMVGAAAR